jgi:parallel beta-helix repeat protein
MRWHLIALVLPIIAHAYPACADNPRPFTVTLNPESPTAGIQEAIDSLGGKPGVMTIPAGKYLLRRSIRVHSGLTLQGAGDETILTKSKQLGSKLSAPAGKDDRSLQVEKSSGFQPGDEIGVYDQSTVGWEHGHVAVKEVRGNELVLDRRIGRAFDPASGAAVINYFPAITGTGIDSVVLSGITIDGHADENPGPAAVAVRGKGKPAELGFTFAAINLVDVTNSRIENCHVLGWPADGISLQRGGNDQITKCTVEKCRGEGFHPGGGLHDSEFFDLEARGNLGNGLYFCARVERVSVKDNKFIGNQKNGIGDLGYSGDKDNLVENNLCEANGQSGIQLWDGTSNTVKNNTCKSNSQSAPGQFSGISILATTSSLISGNHCFDDQPTKTQKHGIEETSNSKSNTVTDNDCRGNANDGIALKGKDGQQSGNQK